MTQRRKRYPANEWFGTLLLCMLTFPFIVAAGMTWPYGGSVGLACGFLGMFAGRAYGMIRDGQR